MWTREELLPDLAEAERESAKRLEPPPRPTWRQRFWTLFGFPHHPIRSKTTTPLREVCRDSRGHTLFVQDNEAGGRTYWSDEIGGGVMVWDTALVSDEMLDRALDAEDKYRSRS